MSISPPHTEFTICDIKPGGPADLSFFILLIGSHHFLVYQAMYTAKCICMRKTIPILCKLCVQKLLIITFPRYFMFITDFQQHHHYIALIFNILISFCHPLCYLKHIKFLVIPLHSNSKSSPFCFTFDLIKISFDLSLCF